MLRANFSSIRCIQTSIEDCFSERGGDFGTIFNLVEMYLQRTEIGDSGPKACNLLRGYLPSVRCIKDSFSQITFVTPLENRNHIKTQSPSSRRSRTSRVRLKRNISYHYGSKDFMTPFLGVRERGLLELRNSVESTRARFCFVAPDEPCNLGCNPSSSALSFSLQNEGQERLKYLDVQAYPPTPQHLDLIPITPRLIIDMPFNAAGGKMTDVGLDNSGNAGNIAQGDANDFGNHKDSNNTDNSKHADVTSKFSLSLILHISGLVLMMWIRSW